MMNYIKPAGLANTQGIRSKSSGAGFLIKITNKPIELFYSNEKTNFNTCSNIISFYHLP